jgi:hypothetical protein
MLMRCFVVLVFHIYHSLQSTPSTQHHMKQELELQVKEDLVIKPENQEDEEKFKQEFAQCRLKQMCLFTSVCAFIIFVFLLLVVELIKKLYRIRWFI